MRPAIKAGIGLRVKTPVEWVGILRGTLRTHGKRIHRRGRSVIRQRPDDGKARSAVSAVDKGVVIASVGGIEQLAQAIVTGSDIGRDERRVRGLVLRCHNAKALLTGSAPTARPQIRNIDSLNAGCRRRMLRKRGNKSIERIGRSVRLDMHAVARVEHPSANAMRHGLAIHKRSHANALHNARHMNMHMPHATPLIKTDQKGTGLFWSVKLLNLPQQTCPFLAGALQSQALLGGGARELAVLNAAQAQQTVGQLVDALAATLERQNL